MKARAAFAGCRTDQRRRARGGVARRAGTRTRVVRLATE